MTDVTLRPAEAGPPSLQPVTVRRIVWFAVGLALFSLGLGAFFGSLILPLAIGGFLTYLLEPLVRYVERWLPRSLAVGAMVVGSVVTMTLVGIHLAPMVYRQILSLMQLVPTALNTALSSWIGGAESFVTNLGLIDEASAHDLFALPALASRIAGQLQSGMPNLWRTGSTLVGGLVNFVLIPVVTFFMLKERERLVAALVSIVPVDLRGPLGRLVARVDRALRAVIKGQAIVAATLTVLYVIGLSLTGIQASVAIGLVAGICRVIPYLDVIVGGALSAVALISGHASWGQVLSVAAVFAVVQTLDGVFITPSVIGERLGLHPLVVVLLVLAFGDWLGFWGVLLAIPVAAIVKVLVMAALPYYRASKAFGRPLDP